MVTVSGPPVSGLLSPSTDEVDVAKMDGLLEELKTSMVELILKGDDVTQQMWRMYSVFEEIFGRQTATTAGNQPLKHVVVGDRLKAPPPATTAPPPAKATTTTTPPATTGQLSSPTPVCTTPNDAKEALPEEDHSSTSPQNKVPPQYPPVPPPQPPSPKSVSSPVPSSVQQPDDRTTPPTNPPSNPLLDTIGALATSNPDSDDSDLDMVYQQLQGRQRKHQDQMRMRTHRTHRHHQVASSDPESIGYAGSNSIDSGYKSLCATPEVSDSLSAPEVRRSASDVSASDSSTTSGRPRSLDGKSGKIKMGTRSSAGKLDRAPRQGAMSDVTLDHLMYLRQSLRKDRPDTQRSPNDSIPSSATSSTFRDSDLSPRTLTDEEWRDSSSRPPSYPLRLPSSSSPDTRCGSPAYSLRQTANSSPDTSCRSSPAYPLRQQTVSSSPDTSCRSPAYSLRQTASSSPDTSCRSPAYSLRQTASSSPDTSCRSPAYPLRLPSSSSPDPFARVDQEGGGESSSDFLLSGVEYYDLESIQEFPPTNNYVTMLEEKTRCARFQVVQTPPRSSEPLTERQLSSLYRKRSDSTQSVDGDVSRCHPQHIYGLAGHHHPHRNSAKALASRHHHHRQQQPPHHQTDSKLTEAAIRVLEMIEDFRMEEAVTRSGRGVVPPPEYRHPGYHHHQQVPTRAYRKSSRRPASTGSLMEHEIDARSVASSSAEHHVCEEIMYDLVCERPPPPPVPPPGGGTRMLPVPPAAASRVDPRRIVVRSHKHSSSNVYSVMAHGRSSVDRFLEMEWQDRRESLPPDFPV